MIKRYVFYFFVIFSLFFAKAVYPCKMDMLGASGLVIQEIIKSVQTEKHDSSREIVKIKKAHINHFSEWTYIIEFSVNSKTCQAVGYTANIEPNCHVEVKRIKKSFSCNN